MSLSRETIGTTPYPRSLVTVHEVKCGLHVGQQYGCADVDNMQRVCACSVGLGSWYVQSIQYNVLFPAP